MAKWVLPGGDRVDIPRNLWFPSAMTVVSLFLGGLYLGTVVGHAPDAGAAYATTLKLKGKVVKVRGKPVRVLVPAKTIVRDGRVVTTLPARTIDLTQAASTVISTHNVSTTVSQTVVVPTTVTETATVPTTVTETATVTDTVTGSTTTDTGTTTVSSSVSIPST